MRPHPLKPEAYPVWRAVHERGWVGPLSLARLNVHGDRVLSWAVAQAPDLLPSLLSLTGARRYVNASNNQGESALMRACRHAPSLVSLLLNAGARVNGMGNRGRTPLMLACEHQPALVPELLAVGADVEVLGTNGRSALHLACVHQADLLPLLTRAAPAWKANLTALTRREMWWCCTLNPQSMGFMLEAGLDPEGLEPLLAKRERPVCTQAWGVWRAWQSKQGLEAAVEAGPPPSPCRPRL